VLFGSEAGTALDVATSSTLDITAPAQAAGTVDVRVVTSYGNSAATIGDLYSYADPPVVSG
jgi:hypothetical protein